MSGEERQGSFVGDVTEIASWVAPSLLDVLMVFFTLARG